MENKILSFFKNFNFFKIRNINICFIRNLNRFPIILRALSHLLRDICCLIYDFSFGLVQTEGYYRAGEWVGHKKQLGQHVCLTLRQNSCGAESLPEAVLLPTISSEERQSDMSRAQASIITLN